MGFSLIDSSMTGDLKISKSFSLVKKKEKNGEAYLNCDLSLGMIGDSEQKVYPSPAGAVGLHYGGQYQIINKPLDNKQQSNNAFKLNASFYGNAVLSSFLFFPSYPTDFGENIKLPFDPRLRIGGQFIGQIEGKFDFGSNSLALRFASELSADFGVHMVFSRYPYINNEISYPYWQIGASFTYNQQSLYYLTGFNIEGLVPLPHELGLTLRPFNNFEANLSLIVPDPNFRVALSYKIGNHIFGVNFCSGNNLEKLYAGMFWRWDFGFGEKKDIEVSANIETRIHSKATPLSIVLENYYYPDPAQYIYSFTIDSKGRISLGRSLGSLNDIKNDVPSDILANPKYREVRVTVYKNKQQVSIRVFPIDNNTYDDHYTIWKGEDRDPLVYNLLKYSSLNGFLTGVSSYSTERKLAILNNLISRLYDFLYHKQYFEKELKKNPLAATTEYRGRAKGKIDGVPFEEIYASIRTRYYNSLEGRVQKDRVQGSSEWTLLDGSHKDLIVCSRIAEFMCYLVAQMGFAQARVVSVGTNSTTHAIVVFKVGGNYAVLDNGIMLMGGSLRESLLMYYRAKGYGPQMRAYVHERKGGRTIRTQVITYDLGRAVDRFTGKRDIRNFLTRPAR